jgi:hypothetical protein
LHGIDLHGADLRGVDFSKADLRGADLSGAVTGRSKGWTIALGVVGIAISWLLGVVAGHVAASLRVWLQGPDPRYRAVAFFTLAATIVFLIVVLWKGTTVALRRVTLIAVAVAAAIGVVIAVTGLGSGVAPVAALLLVLVAAAIVLIGILARVSAGSALPWLFYIAAIGGGLVGREAGGGIMVAAMAIVAALVGKRELRGKSRDPLVHRWVEVTSCLGGTRFRGADLTGAKLHGATLRNSDFRDARVDDSQLKDVNKLESCAFGPRGRQVSA